MNVYYTVPGTIIDIICFQTHSNIGIIIPIL